MADDFNEEFELEGIKYYYCGPGGWPEVAQSLAEYYKAMPKPSQRLFGMVVFGGVLGAFGMHCHNHFVTLRQDEELHQVMLQEHQENIRRLKLENQALELQNKQLEIDNKNKK